MTTQQAQYREERGGMLKVVGMALLCSIVPDSWIEKWETERREREINELAARVQAAAQKHIDAASAARKAAEMPVQARTTDDDSISAADWGCVVNPGSCGCGGNYR